MNNRQLRNKLPDIYPNWLKQYSISIYLLALAIVSLVYSAYSLPWYYMLSGVVAVIAFFYFGGTIVKDTSVWKKSNNKKFEKRLILIAFVPRVLLTLLLYWLFQANYGDEFGFENADATFYNDLGQRFADAIANGSFIKEWQIQNQYLDVSDLGYGSYLGLVYALTGKSIIAVRLIKCVMSTITVVLMYRLAKRNFGEQTGRITAICIALWPNFWYYCTCHLKEVEMVFLGVLFVEQADQMLRSRQFTVWKVVPVLLIAAAIFTFRTPLGLVALLALVFSVVLSSAKVVSWGKRIIVGVLAIGLIAITMGGQLEQRAQSLLHEAQSDKQQTNMSWRAEREHGNAFAKYAGAAVFAPMIFTLPFPTMVKPFDGQETQQLLNGGNYIKNIISYFTIMAMVLLLISGQWREHLLPLSFMLGYLVVLMMSTFAQAERFHQPAMPFEIMFAAYGLSIAVTKPKFKRWFTYWCVLMFVACVAWNWFKLAGRGLS